MAIRSRKLFPAGTGTNQTMDCSDFCYPGCPYDCYTFPEFYFSPPPPALYSAAHGPQQKHAVPTLAIIMIALFVGFFFCFSYYIVAIKCRSCCSSSRNVGAERSGSEGAEGEFVDENQVDHHIWFITTAGLQQSVINSITACKYKKGEGLIEGTECSVCLSEFQEDEMLRLLPKCSHAFHSRCVDTWLRSHTTCPLCRARILTDIATSNIVRPPSLASVNQNEANIAANEETQMENNGETNGEVVGGENQVVPGGSFENRGEVDDQREVINQVGEIIPKEGIESDESNGNVETQEHETVRTQMDSSSAGCEGRSVKAT